MNVLLTGAFGNVGLSTLGELIKGGHKVRAFNRDSPGKRGVAKKYEGRAEIVWGDVRNYEDVKKAVSGQDVVIHLAAIIPPLADQEPRMAESVNVGGTANIIKAMKGQPNNPRIIYSSSVAIYGDRIKSPLIKNTDPPNPNSDDEYAKQKLKCEDLIRNSGLEWAIFRLTYIVSPADLKLKPIMFKMPLGTSLEVCHTKDAGLALANAVENDEIWGQTLHIAGGKKCRISYRRYLARMFGIMGLGSDFLPDEAFSKGEFHSGFMTTGKSQKYLDYHKHTLEDCYNEVKRKVGVTRYFMMLFRPVIRWFILKKSPYYKAYLESKS